MIRTKPITLAILSSWMITGQGADTAYLAKILHWQSDCHSICKGYFIQDPEMKQVDRPPPMTEATTTITAKNGVSFSYKGKSTIRGEVIIRQKGRELQADQVNLYQDPKTKQVDRVELIGNVRYEEHDRLLTSQYAQANLQENTLSSKEGAFRSDHPTPHETLHAWGVTNSATKDSCGNIILTDTTYSVCPITNPTWQIRAKEITLDKQTGVALARNAKFYVFGVPVLYLPWINYPIKRERKSGFLLPNLSFDQQDGFSMDIPYYLNLAPNYDAILSINPMTKRGIKLNGHYRYLTQLHHGQMNFGFIPRDREFISFQRHAPNEYRGQALFAPYLSRINNASTDRFGTFLRDQTKFDCHWAGSLRLAYASDDYYLRDFGSNPIDSNQNQLLNQVQLHYYDEHWQLSTRAMGYQTLHPIASLNPELYSRLPEVTAYASYPHDLLGLDYELWVDYTNFDHRKDFISNSRVVSGQRLHGRPGIGAHFNKPWGFFTPEVRLDATCYRLRDQSIESDTKIQRFLPIASIDSGLIFERNGSCFRQTLEPRLYYLWVPKKNQDDIPIFDTTLPRFSFEQFFYYNRFTGLDRFGDANQITFGLSSHWYEQNTGMERFITNLGVLYQFQKRSVWLYPDCSDDPTRNQKISPLLMNVIYRMSLTSYLQADIAWSPIDNRTETGNVRLHYEPATNHIIHIGYDFVREGDRIPGTGNNDLSRIDIGWSWNLNRQWQFMANWNYNVSHEHLQHYLAGISYDACCVAIRAIASRTALDVAYSDNTRYDTKYYLEIKLKGLGTVGNGRPSSLLNTSIVGYQDMFR